MVCSLARDGFVLRGVSIRICFSLWRGWIVVKLIVCSSCIFDFSAYFSCVGIGGCYLFFYSLNKLLEC